MLPCSKCQNIETNHHKDEREKQLVHLLEDRELSAFSEASGPFNLLSGCVRTKGEGCSAEAFRVPRVHIGMSKQKWAGCSLSRTSIPHIERPITAPSLCLIANI